ncbi:MAG: hypothetical protein A2061_08415 [Gallionellales bacterium GWA2_59_43]|nr:MAG: hypothetical protein A2061_08415 [Gallionellales bacterium GWA2_59_43]
MATAPSNATITAPAVGTTATQGDSLTYTAGNAANPDGFTLNHTWLFTGGMPNASGQSVSVPMTVAGNITATLEVRNSVGMLATGTTPTRSVTVSAAENQAPTATIDAPTGNVTVTQGGTVTFQGSGTDPDGNTPLTYSWDFGGGATNSTQQNPGAVTFNTVGAFTVSFTVTDSLGLASTAVTRVITVTSPANQAPTATISAPTGNVTVTQGGTVTFQGSGTDPDGNTPLTYSWDFGGGATNSTQQNPGAVTFNTVGAFTVSFTVTDSLGLASTAVTRMITVTSLANQPPVATIGSPAGNVTVTQGGAVTFQGSGTDPDGNTPLTYSWDFGGGATNSTQQNPGAVTFNTVGTFTVSFTVTDSLGLVSTAVTRMITVTSPANQAPTATISAPTGNVTVTQGGTVTFQGSGTDPDGNTPLTYSWDFGGGATNSTQQNPGAVTFNTVGTFTVSFTVTDSLGLASTAVTRTVTVTAVGQQQPVAVIEEPKQDLTIVQGRSVEFHATADGTDEDDDDLTFNWSFPGGTPASSTRKEIKVFFNTAGAFTATLVVTDSQGVASAPVTRTVTTTPSPNAPVASINAPEGNVTIAQGGAVNFMGSGTDPDNRLPLTYSWDFGGGAANSTQQNPGMVTFNTVGTFTVTFRVTDNRRLVSAPVTRTITVTPPANQAPTATISAPTGNVTVTQGGTVTFQGSGTDPDSNTPLTYSWDFGGGATNSTQQNPGAVTFNTVGTFTVSFTVTDSLGLSSAAVTRIVTVTPPPNMAPTATISAPAGDVTVAQGGTVTFQGSGTDPDGNTPLTYSWDFGGGATNSTQQNPGEVTFDTVGTFIVTFTVTDSLGLASEPVIRTVTVTAAGLPVAEIVAPAMNVSVLPGGRVTFRGVASGSANLPLRFRWTFQGGNPERSTRQNPGAVRFRDVGMHTVTLTVTDSEGEVSAPVTRVITVAPANASRIGLDDDCINIDDDDD